MHLLLSSCCLAPWGAVLLIVTLFASAQPAIPAPLEPTASVRPPAAAASPDERFQQLWEALKERVQVADQFLIQGRVGEGADGYIGVPPGVNLSTEEKTWIQDENTLRRQVYEAMAGLSGTPAAEMGAQRAKRYSSRLKKGILREVVSAKGSREWADGYTDDERIHTYVLEFAAPPPGRVEATKPFSITLQVRDALGRPAAHPSLAGVWFSVASAQPSDGLAGITTVPLVNGVAHFTALSYPAVISPTKLYFKGLGLLAHLKLETQQLSVLKKQISPEDIESYLPAWERRALRLLNLPPSPSRDRELAAFRRELEESITSFQSYSGASPLTSQKLTDLHLKVEAALALSPSAPPEGAGNPAPLPPR